MAWIHVYQGLWLTGQNVASSQISLQRKLSHNLFQFQVLQLIVLAVFGTRGLTTCLQYVRTPSQNLVCNDSGFVTEFDVMDNNFYIVFDYVLHISLCLTLW